MFIFLHYIALSHHKFRKLILEYNNLVDPDGVKARLAGRIWRKVFYTAGVNHIWAFCYDRNSGRSLNMHLGSKG